MLEMLEEFGESLPIPLLTYDEKGTVVYANPTFHEVAEKIVEGDVVGKNIFDFIHPEDKERAIAAVKKRLAGEKVEPYTLRLKDVGGGYRPYLIVGGIGHYMGKRLGITLTDVTKIEERKLMLLIINRALRHDVLNALTAAMAYLESGKEACKNCENSIFSRKPKRQ